jgi:hypothetical protein
MLKKKKEKEERGRNRGRKRRRKEGREERKEGRKKCKSQKPVTHACNPSYSRGRDQEDVGSKPAWTNNSQDPILKKPITKKGW